MELFQRTSSGLISDQKISIMPYLIIGISLSSLLSISGCDQGEVDHIQQAEYVYVNKSTNSLRFELYNSSSNSSIEFDLKSNDSITFIVSGTPGAFPFTENEIQNRTGDSVIFRLNEDKCTYYTRNSDSGTFGGDGVFNLEEYENYALERVGAKKYRLVYFIDEKDFERSINCL